MPVTLPRVSARKLQAVIEAHAYYPSDVAAGLETLLETTNDEATSLLAAAELLRMTDQNGSPSEVASLMESATLVDRRALLRYYVEDFAPFAHWKRRVAQGFDPLDAARQTKAIFEITNSSADIRDWFIELGVFSGAIQEDGTKIAPVTGKPIELGSVVADILNRGESAVSSLESYLGPATWGTLPETTREHLVRAVERLSQNAPSDEVVRAVGLGMDVYLTALGEQVIGGYANQGFTMGQVINQLEQDGVIVTKQKQVLGNVLALRNAAEHQDTDADIHPDSWSINPKSAQTCLRVALDIVRSIDARQQGRHEL